MEQNIVPSLDGSGDCLLSTRLFTIDDYVMFCDEISEREIKQCYLELNSDTTLSSKKKRALEERIKYIMEKREGSKQYFYKIFDNPEMHEKAPVEMERRKKENMERLRLYGLNI